MAVYASDLLSVEEATLEFPCPGAVGNGVFAIEIAVAVKPYVDFLSAQLSLCGGGTVRLTLGVIDHLDTTRSAE